MLRSLLLEDMTLSLDYPACARQLQGYSGSDIKLLCKEAAMKPMRRLMQRLENMEDDSTLNWHIPADPKSTPRPEPITLHDFTEAYATTRAATLIPQDKYQQWFKEFGSS
jgi:katanin p60 ATPase-containing subunit A1